MRRLDRLDREILGLIRGDARASFVSLGARVGLSANAVADRVRRLERDGVITGYRAELHPAALGRPLDVLINVRMAAGRESGTFEQLVANISPVHEVLFLTGRFDYQLRLGCRNAVELDVALRTIRSQPGVAETETHVVLRRSNSAHPDPQHKCHSTIPALT